MKPERLKLPKNCTFGTGPGRGNPTDAKAKTLPTAPSPMLAWIALPVVLPVDGKVNVTNKLAAHGPLNRISK
jgi:hypothetical protein